MVNIHQRLGGHVTVGKTLRRATHLLAAAAASMPAGPVRAQQDGAPVSIGTYRVIDSHVLGEERRLLIHLPHGYEGAAISYPVVYHTYGDYLSQYYAEAFSTLEQLGTSGRIPQMILVGIDNIDRYRDLRPLTNDGASSGADRYMRFLTQELIPFVERQYRTSPYRIVVGPQAGAVFGLYALQENPDLFDAFILNNPFTSPPNTEWLFSHGSELFGSDAPLQKFVYITFGGADESESEIADVYRLADSTVPMRDRGFELHLNSVVGNDDFIVPLDLDKALKTLFARYYVPDDRYFADLAAIRTFYADLSSHYGFDVPPAEHVMTRSADALHGRGDLARTIEILEYQTTLYPSMVNAWWRLAGIAAERGEIDEAIDLYEKCQEIDSSMANFVTRRIEQLRARR
jgi:predicted alpha/beta superfamily hydrolase